MYKTIKYLGATSLLMLSMGAQATVIDLFSTDQATLTDSTTGDGGIHSSVGGGVDPTILGGSRDLYVELLTQFGTNTAKIGVNSGAMSFSVDAGSTGTGIVQWDGNDDSIALDMTGLGGVDITGGGGLNAFAVTTLFSDLGYEFVIGAYTDANFWTVISFEAHAVDFGSPVTSLIPFSGFTNPALCGAVNPVPGVNSITCGAGGTVDFANLGALELLIDPNGGTVSVDLILDQVVTVPEPSVLGLLGAALLAGGFVSARKRKTA